MESIIVTAYTALGDWTTERVTGEQERATHLTEVREYTSGPYAGRQFVQGYTRLQFRFHGRVQPGTSSYGHYQDGNARAVARALMA